jgi:hypothetical protein
MFLHLVSEDVFLSFLSAQALFHPVLRGILMFAAARTCAHVFPRDVCFLPFGCAGLATCIYDYVFYGGLQPLENLFFEFAWLRVAAVFLFGYCLQLGRLGGADLSTEVSRNFALFPPATTLAPYLGKVLQSILGDVCRRIVRELLLGWPGLALHQQLSHGMLSCAVLCEREFSGSCRSQG